MKHTGARQYKTIDQLSASKEEILDRLFSRLLRDIRDASRAEESGDIEARASGIDHALRILAELQAALDHGRAPELCQNLEALYQYAVDCLIAQEGHQGGYREAVNILEHVQESYRLARSQLAKSA